MSKILKTSLIAIGSTVVMAGTAQAGDYKLQLRWDDTQSTQQNYDAASEKIETYCKIQVRRDGGYTPAERLSATSYCQDQLIRGFVKRTDKAALTQYFAALSHPSNGDVSSKGKS